MKHHSTSKFINKVNFFYVIVYIVARRKKEQVRCTRDRKHITSQHVCL